MIECDCIYYLIRDKIIWHIEIGGCKTWTLHYILIKFNLYIIIIIMKERERERERERESWYNFRRDKTLSSGE